MMDEQDSRLAETCRAFGRHCAEAAAWVNDNQDIVRGERDGLLRELRRSARLFRTCGESALRKMCVGVFGPSQAGKSYLISSIARTEQGKLFADFSGRVHNFITEINPPGGRECTGLVTRFTTTPPLSTPPSAPVCLQLLTETDLVKILANTYYADCEHAEAPDSAVINNALTAIEGRVAENSPAGRIDLDALEDLREYLEKEFRSRPRVQELERSFWVRAFQIGPRLDLAGRIQLYSLIWNQTPAFTALLTTLLGALEQLGHPAEAFAPMQALIPRERSIIDVITLQGLDKLSTDATPAEEMLELLTASGARAMLPRCVVTALTAELTIVMSESPAPLFEHTDLLDFPGYRTRHKFTNLNLELEKPNILKDLFLRGKVAFLFQRYCARRELTSMLLCIEPSNQDVQDLPGVINEWIYSTHGETPEAREGKTPSLFFVLTKSDMQFAEKAGDLSVQGRWDTRLHSSLLDFFGKQYDWPTKWTPTTSFNNLFLLRNISYKCEAILDYKEDLETGVRETKREFVQKIKEDFLNSTVVARHFVDPSESWDAFMKLNDGGIGLIRAKLQPVCEPELKRCQIRTTLRERLKHLTARLKPFWKSDDSEELRQEKLRLYKTLSQILAAQIERGHFAELLSRMGVHDHDLQASYFEAEQLARRQGDGVAMAASAPTVQAADLLSDLGDLFDDDTDPVPAPAPLAETRPRDAAAAFAELIENKWLEQLHKLADDPAMQGYYQFPGQEFTAFINEMAMGAERQHLRQELEDSLRRAAQYANVERERLIWKQSSLAAEAINAYISWLGFNPRLKPSADRTMHVKGKTIVLFEPPMCADSYPELPEMPSGREKQWYGDWLRALYQLIMDNVNFDGERTINFEENNRLGHILKELAPQQESA